MRILGLDVGDRSIGVALSDETGTIATGLSTVRRIGPKRDVKAIADLVREHDAREVVVGLPRKMDGTLGIQAQKTLDFVESIRPAVGVPIVPWDERLTTVAARHALLDANVSRKGRRAVIDKVSAILILQNYLDYLKIAAGDTYGPQT